MKKQPDNLPIMSFESASALRKWLHENHATSDGIWVRIGKKHSAVASITFHELLDEGLCFGWSESTRRSGDEQSYLQRFTPRRTKGTKSMRNQERVQRLIEEGRMMPSGLEALCIRADLAPNNACKPQPLRGLASFRRWASGTRSTGGRY